MYVSFEDLPKSSQIWIYSSEDIISKRNQLFVLEYLKAFLEKWAAHGNTLVASVKLFFDRFVIIGVDKTVHTPSGCAIDESVAALRTLRKELKIDFLNRNFLFFKARKTTGDIFSVDNTQIKIYIERDKILPDMFVFNNAITTKESLKKHWLIKVKDSWIKRYLKKSTSSKIFLL